LPSIAAIRLLLILLIDYLRQLITADYAIIIAIIAIIDTPFS
jgi:hypothetical protein